MPTLKLLLAVCMAVASVASFAQEAPNTQYKGGNVVLEAGGQVGMDKFGMYGASLAVLGGYTFNKHLFVGGGIGFKQVMIDDQSCISIPLFARVKYSFLKSKVTPYISLDAGYSAGGVGIDYSINPDYKPKEGDIWIDEIQGGLYLRPELGISVRLKKRQALHFGVGYDRQRGNFQRYEQTSNGLKSKEYDSLGELTFRIGITL